MRLYTPTRKNNKIRVTFTNIIPFFSSLHTKLHVLLSCFVHEIQRFDRVAPQTSKTGKLLVVPFDFRIPLIRIQTRQYSQLVNQRILVRIDSWDLKSKYIPNDLFSHWLHQTQIQRPFFFTSYRPKMKLYSIFSNASLLILCKFLLTDIQMDIIFVHWVKLVLNVVEIQYICIFK